MDRSTVANEKRLRCGAAFEADVDREEGIGRPFRLFLRILVGFGGGCCGWVGGLEASGSTGAVWSVLPSGVSLQLSG